MKHTRPLAVLLIFCVVFCLSPLSAALYGDACGIDTIPEPSGYAAFAVELTTGTVLYEKNADEQLYPASTTKLMTALLAAERIEAGEASLDDVITFSYDAVYGIPRDTTHIAIDVGEELTVRQVLYAMLLPSANEACIGMAEYIAGSADAFVALMNERAAALGMTNSHFVTTNGLHDDQHYMSARDLATLMRECLKHELLVEIMSTPTYEIPPTNKTSETRYLVTTNDLQRPRSGSYNDKVVCGKTGFTTPAANTLATYSEYNGLQYVIAIMKAPKGTTFKDTSAFVDYFAENLKSVSVDNTIDFAKSVPTADGGSLLLEPAAFSVLCHTADDFLSYERVYDIPDQIAEPTAAGTPLGSLRLYDNGYLVGEAQMLARGDYLLSSGVTDGSLSSEPDPAVSGGEQTASPGADKRGGFAGTLVKFLLIALCVALFCAMVYGVVVLISVYLHNRKKDRRRPRRSRSFDDHDLHR